MTRNLSEAARCPECAGLVAAGRQCRRCKSLEEKAMARIQREVNAADEAQRASAERSVRACVRRMYLRRYVADFIAQPHGKRVAWAERNPLRMW